MSQESTLPEYECCHSHSTSLFPTPSDWNAIFGLPLFHVGIFFRERGGCGGRKSPDSQSSVDARKTWVGRSWFDRTSQGNAEWTDVDYITLQDILIRWTILQSNYIPIASPRDNLSHTWFYPCPKMPTAWCTFLLHPGFIYPWPIQQYWVHGHGSNIFARISELRLCQFPWFYLYLSTNENSRGHFWHTLFFLPDPLFPPRVMGSHSQQVISSLHAQNRRLRRNLLFSSPSWRETVMAAINYSARRSTNGAGGSAF